MKGIKIEIQTTLLALVIILAAVVSGFYFFRDLPASLMLCTARQNPILY
jgi:hypothetical protein